MPDFVRAAYRQKTLRVKNPGYIRPWIHVLDALFGYLSLIEKLSFSPQNFSGSWNFGSSSEHPITVEDLIQKLNSNWPSSILIEKENLENHFEDDCLLLNTEKTRKQLGFDCSWNIDFTVEKVIEWYREFFEGADAKELCIRQIKSYLHLNCID